MTKDELVAVFYVIDNYLLMIIFHAAHQYIWLIKPHTHATIRMQNLMVIPHWIHIDKIYLLRWAAVHISRPINTCTPYRYNVLASRMIQ